MKEEKGSSLSLTPEMVTQEESGFPSKLDWRKLSVFLQSHIWLILLGTSCEVVYLVYLLHDFPLLGHYHDLTDMGIMNGYSHTGFLKFQIGSSILFLLFGLACYEVRRSHDRMSLPIIFAFGALFAVTLIFVYPVTAIDVFIYIAQSLVLVQHHANPMVTAPVQFANQDPLMYLAGGFITQPSPYGPLGVVIAAIPSLIAGKNVLLTLVLIKVLFSALLLTTAFLVYKVLSALGAAFALVGAIALAWNPFVLFEYVVNSHNDIVMVFFLVVAVYALTKERYVLALTLVMASALIKFASFPVVPLFFLYGLFQQPSLQKRLRYIAFGILIPALFTIACFVPFWAGPQTLARVLNQTQDQLYSFSMFLTDFSSGTISANSVKVIGMVFFGGCFLYALWKAQENLAGLLEGCFLTLFSLLAFGVTYIQVWYLLWPLVFAILIPRTRTYLAAFLLAYAALIVELVHAYIFPWGGYANADTFAIVNSVVYLVLFSPTLLLGVVHFFVKGRGGRIREKDREEANREDESQEEQTRAEYADVPGERRDARRAGDDPMEKRAPVGDMARARSGGR